MIQIPIRGGAENARHTFDMQLGENLLSFRVCYITTQGPAWSMDVRKGGTLLMAGVMLEPGSILTELYDVDLGGELAFVGKDVTLDNLGVENFLVWVPHD